MPPRRPVRVGFEPEPGCLVESTRQPGKVLSGMDTDRLGICLDLAHLACAWEESAAALDRLRDAGRGEALLLELAGLSPGGPSSGGLPGAGAVGEKP
ncbi:hypothetical protein JNW88_09940 [Micromonospora sp. ATA32]|nr:hypothetical protein [Micromonospora sp. ATA32]